MAEAIQFIRVLNIMLVGACAFLLIRWILCNGNSCLYAVAPLTWVFNIGAFYIFRLFFVNSLTIATLNLWSMTIATHGLVVIFAVLIILLREQRTH